MIKDFLKKFLAIVATVCFMTAGFTSCDDIIKNASSSTENNSDQISESSDSETSNRSSEGLIYTLSSDETYYIVTGAGSCADEDIVIPSEYNGLSVAEIGKRAFEKKTEIKSVAIPDSIVSIGEEAFWECYALTNVTIGENVTSIGAYAFCWEYSLASVTFNNPDGWKVAREANSTSWTDVPKSVLSDAATAAMHLKLTYYQYYWKRG